MRKLKDIDLGPSLEWLPADTVRSVLGDAYPLVGKASLPEQINFLEHAAVALFNLCPPGKREAAIAAISAPSGSAVQAPANSAPAKKNDEPTKDANGSESVTFDQLLSRRA